MGFEENNNSMIYHHIESSMAWSTTISISNMALECEPTSLDEGDPLLLGLVGLSP